MFKRTAALIISLVMLVSLSAPAFAAGESLDEKLARVTLIVKETLGIEDKYTDFSGDFTEQGSTSYWNLSWTSEEESLYVTADENGKVLRYSDNQYSIYDRINNFYGYAPIFSKTNAKDAFPVAEAFIKKVLDDNESADFGEYDTQYFAVNASDYSFSGNVMLNGLKSPINFHIIVDAEDMSVRYFYRTDGYGQYVGAIPSATASVSAQEAFRLLSAKNELSLQYVLKDNEKTAVLRYLPVYSGSYIVDAKTGELVNVDELYDDLRLKNALGGMNEASAEAPAAENGGLSDVEQSTVEVLEGVYSKDELDKAVRAVAELGIGGGVVLSSVNYSMNKETGEVTAYLSYTEKITDESEIKQRFPEDYSDMSKWGVYPIYNYKNVSVNAKTGELIAVYSSSTSAYGEGKALTSDQLEEKAKSFIKKYFPEKHSATALNDTSSNTEEAYFVYSQTVNGILFPANSLYISVNTYDGTIESFNIGWTDGVEFDSADGIIDAGTALKAYNGCFKAVLQYAVVPATTQLSDYNIEQELRLAYKNESEKAIVGIDAKTGEAIIAEESKPEQQLAYDDIENCYGRAQIEKLAGYGIGFPGASFMPRAQLTQKDALVLFLSAVGFSSDDEDALYQEAYYYGFISKDEREPSKLISRAELVKILIGATEYGAAGKLTGIYKSGFADDGSIPAEYYGYVSIAKGLGVIRGDTFGRFNPGNIVSRQDAAIMLYNFMSR
ncbi:MAG: S-layer homology domain-containing protein [Oscillospiraceae bacterium]